MEQNRKYYDKLFTKKYREPYTKSVYLPMWKNVLSFLDKNNNILDIGCGPGQFGHFLSDNSINKYTGIDFSAVAIDRALTEYNNSTHYYHQVDINTNMYYGIIKSQNFDVFICMEVLEHINNDIRILELLPAGKKIIFSVPTFDDPAHVRSFPNFHLVKARYSKYVDFSRHLFINNRWHLCVAIIK